MIGPPGPGEGVGPFGPEIPDDLKQMGVAFMRHSPEVRALIREVVSEALKEELSHVATVVDERVSRGTDAKIAAAKEEIVATMGRELRAALQETQGQAKVDNGSGRGSGLIEQVLAMMMRGGLQGDRPPDSSLDQVSKMVSSFSAISNAVMAPAFANYDMGYKHALQTFGYFSRSSPEDREAFVKNIPSVAGVNGNYRTSEEEAKRIAGV